MTDGAQNDVHADTLHLRGLDPPPQIAAQDDPDEFGPTQTWWVAWGVGSGGAVLECCDARCPGAFGPASFEIPQPRCQ